MLLTSYTNQRGRDRHVAGFRPAAIAAVRRSDGVLDKVAAVRSPAQPHEPLTIPSGMQLASEATPGVPVQTFPAGSLVFTPTEGPVPLTDSRLWWKYVPGAQWRHPQGPRRTCPRRHDPRRGPRSSARPPSFA